MTPLDRIRSHLQLYVLTFGTRRMRAEALWMLGISLAGYALAFAFVVIGEAFDA